MRGLTFPCRITSLASFSLVVVVYLVASSSSVFGATTQTGPSLFRYGAFATSNTCGAITLTGTSSTDSFDSSQGTYAATEQNSGGNIGTNGNIRLSGSVNVAGTASSPHNGTGACSNQSLTALTSNGNASISGGIVLLASPMSYRNPPAPSPAPPTTSQNISGACGNIAGCTPLSGSKNLSLTPGQYGNLSVTGGTTIHLQAGTYQINTLALSGTSDLVIDSTPILLNFSGQGLAANDTAVDLSGGSMTNATDKSSGFQIVYGGTATIKLSGGAHSYGVVYAPNAGVVLGGGADWFGAIIASTVTDSGNSALHYDRALGNMPLAITANPDPAANAAGWNNTNVNVSFSCSGILVTSCSSPASVTTEGSNQPVSGTARDISGAAVTVTLAINLDKTPPTVTTSRLPVANMQGWNNTNVTVSIVGNDTLSGLAACSTPVTLTNEGANQSALGSCTDVAGNVTQATVVGINIDKTRPIAAATASPQPNARGWNNTDVTVTFTGTDSLSGIASCSSPVALTNEGANQSASGGCTDNAGNIGSFTVAQINIDKTPPVLSITTPANGSTVFASPFATAGTARDALSGVDTVTCNGTAATLSATTFKCTVAFSTGANTFKGVATDIAGNSTTQNVLVTYSRVPKVTITAPANLSWFNITPTTVTGTVDDPTATVTVNAVQAAVVGGAFSVAVPLQEGPNVITASATSSNGAIGTASIEVNLDTTPPHVTITSPADKFVTTDTSVSVSGNINDIVVGTVNDQQASVTVNGLAAQVANRTFLAMNVPVALGDNIIQAVGRDRVGNFATSQITVTRQAPTTQAQIKLISGNNQTGTVGTALSAPLVVALTDSGGSPAGNKPIIFKVTQNDGKVSSVGAAASSVFGTTNAQGQAQVQWTLGMRAGAGGNTVEAYAVGFAGTAIFTATGNQAAAGKIVLDTGNHQIGTIGQALPKPLIAVVIDNGNNRLAGVPVTFTVGGGGGSVNGQTSFTVNTDSDGRAAATLALGSQEGNDNNLVEATFPNNQGFPAAFTASGRATGNPTKTTISGVVLDNSNVPIPGVTIRAVLTNVLNSNPSSTQTAASVQTNAQGQFSITPAPVGFVKLLVDGSTAQAPGTYPSLEYDLVTVAGQTNTVGNAIYLLPLSTRNQLCVTSNTGGGTLTVPEAPGFSLTFSPGQVTFPGGSKAGCISVSVVHPDKVPMVPGFGQQPRFIVTIQPPGAMFNPPAPITLPNVDALPPRAVTEMYSYDHDISSFVAIGTGVVSDDGQVIRSSPGVGVLKSGWHCGGNPQALGTAADCPDCNICVPTSAHPEGECKPNPAQDTHPTSSGQCCYGGSPIPMQAPDISTLLNQCTNRGPNTSNKFVDGCSIGIPNVPSTNIQNPVAFLYGPLIANMASTAFGQFQGSVPGSGVLSLPCNQHDLCYQTCTSNKLTCDEGIRTDAYGVCGRAYPSSSCPYSGLQIVLCPEYFVERAGCFDTADLVADSLEGRGLLGSVVGPIAQSAWNDGQVKHCDCCRP